MEGEKHIDVAKNQLAVCEHREAKLKKELKKVAKRATMDELNQLEDRLGTSYASIQGEDPEICGTPFFFFSIRIMVTYGGVVCSSSTPVLRNPILF